MAEGVGFEPTTPVSQGKRLAGARTRPLCDPSVVTKPMIIVYFTISQPIILLKSIWRLRLTSFEGFLRLCYDD